MLELDHDDYAAFIAGVMNLIKLARDQEARELFNDQYTRYKSLLTAAASPQLPFFIDVDEYLNNAGAHILQRTSREYILGAYEDEKENYL